MAQIKNIYIVKTKVTDFIVVKDLGKPAPILWFNGGLWGLVNKARVSNMIQLMDDAGSIPKVHTPPEFKIFWEEIIPVPTKLAEAISGELK